MIDGWHSSITCSIAISFLPLFPPPFYPVIDKCDGIRNLLQNSVTQLILPCKRHEFCLFIQFFFFYLHLFYTLLLFSCNQNSFSFFSFTFVIIVMACYCFLVNRDWSFKRNFAKHASLLCSFLSDFYNLLSGILYRLRFVDFAINYIGKSTSNLNAKKMRILTPVKG